MSKLSKMNPGLYSSESQDWQTPPHVWQAILGFEDRKVFDIDAATSKAFNVSAQYHWTPEGLFCGGANGAMPVKGFGDCGLTGEWGEGNLTWLNPPYGNQLKLFMKKAYEESLKGCRIWALIPARTETQYQHNYGLTQAGFTVFLKGRLHFLQNGEDKGSAPFPTMVLYYGDDADEKAERWAKEMPLPGTVMRRVREYALSLPNGTNTANNAANQAKEEA